MSQAFPLEYLVISLVFLFIMFVMYLVVGERARREKHRLELQKAILERVGSVKDLAEFLATAQGERFLTTLAPAQFSSHYRGLWSIRVGIVLLAVGLFLMVAVHTVPGADTTAPLMFMLLVLIALGGAMLLSAALSFVIARRLGLNGREKSKTDPV